MEDSGELQEHDHTTTGASANVSTPNATGCSHRLGGRNLIVCIDGTSNQFGKKNTNVIELYKRILKKVDDKQKTWYNSGIGTYARPSWKSVKFHKKVLAHKMDLAIAWNFERTVLGAYRWLSDNYEEGDCIFLFGFSRGAFQVRVLSAMIDTVGLIYKGNEMQIPFAFELYVDSENDKGMATHFKSAFSHPDVTVHFVGAWDTVSSIGIVREKKMLPRTVEGMTHVCYFRHALALDERRVKFLPEYAYGGAATRNDTKATNSVLDDSPRTKNQDKNRISHDKEIKRPHTLEVWFPGTHSDIGGGNVENPGMDRGRPPLRWMALEAKAVGLLVLPFERELSPEEQFEIKESLTWRWRIFEILPFKRLTFTKRGNGTEMTYKPHCCKSRKIHPGQKIHSSLLLGDQSYTPKARPWENSSSFWEERRQEAFLSPYLELDVFNFTQTVMECFIAGHQVATLETLRKVATSDEGRQAAYDSIIWALKSEPHLRPEVKHELVRYSKEIFGKDIQLELEPSTEIRPLLSDLNTNTEYQKAAQEFIEQFADHCICALRGHEHWVQSVAFSPVANLVVSGSYDGTLRIWDAETGKQVGDPLGGQKDPVYGVTFSPDGERIASGSGDNVRIWDVGMREQLGETLQGHKGRVYAVAFSPNGDYIASCSQDETIRIWDAAKRILVGEPLKGRGPLFAVAFSPNGKLIAAGSNDMTVDVWNVETGVQEGAPFKGHTKLVSSVVFLGGNRIISSSRDKTIRIWDLETRAEVGDQFSGHTDWVRCVSISPDGTHLVSGSDDKTLRIWDVKSGKQVGEPLKGDDWVLSVAFSYDGKRIASGSKDNTVRIWDMETHMARAKATSSEP